MRCRICESDATRTIAVYRPYVDYSVTVFDCSSCGCRFVAHDPGAHERLHANRSTYTPHAEAARTAERYFRAGNTTKLKTFLSKAAKNAFVIRFIDHRPSVAKIAEIGCSRGYLSSYFIATGRQLCGFDVSPTAVTEAKRAFGPHFYPMSEQELAHLGPFDAIFHVGTIGCVEKPIQMTHLLLSVLKPGGWLLFNAPIREHLEQTQSLWLDTPPPDLVSIFPLGFWRAQFESAAKVEVSVSRCSIYEALLAKRNALHAQNPSEAVVATDHAPPGRPSSRLRQFLGRALAKASRPLTSDVVQPYGAFVAMQKKT